MRYRASLLLLAVMFAACSHQNVNVQPLTPAQTLALVKIGIPAAITTLDVRIAKLEPDAANAEKVRILKAVKGIVEEFNRQIVDVAVIDLTNRATIRAAIDKALKGADNLTNIDVLNLKDPAVIAEIRGLIGVARGAVAAFEAFIPPEPK